MAYTPLGWVSKESADFDQTTSPKINADNLKHMENGIIEVEQNLTTESRELKTYCNENILCYSTSYSDLKYNANDVGTKIMTIPNFDKDKYLTTITLQRSGAAPYCTFVPLTPCGTYIYLSQATNEFVRGMVTESGDVYLKPDTHGLSAGIAILVLIPVKKVNL